LRLDFFNFWRGLPFVSGGGSIKLQICWPLSIQTIVFTLLIFKLLKSTFELVALSSSHGKLASAETKFGGKVTKEGIGFVVLLELGSKLWHIH
jgi:hypothetical protein